MPQENTYIYRYTVPQERTGRVYDYLREVHNYSSRLISMIIRDGELRLNGEPVKFKTDCFGSDIIEVILPAEYPDAESSDISLGVIYEDDDIIVLDKQPGVVVHPTKSHQKDTLANAVYRHWEKTGHTGKIRFVTRIDMDTSGIVIGAKNKYVHHFIQSSFSQSSSKIYYAVVKGCPKIPQGTVSEPVGREEYMSMKRVVRDDAKPSVTEYAVAEEFRGYSLLRLRLHTGRTHQIRVHMSHIGCPVISDALYNPEPNEFIGRQALHSGELSLIHPRTKELLTFAAPFPPDFDFALKALRKL